ncbi:hypothetical protein L226DRAFT_284039 [Lentinus tigrinus ALCF2SS1-7]|uniref:uncharacterized protein n=1 Tax=Lentinus tigrinus ALCF2SS1-7 TaxID=1328758 RepID=UPI001165FFB8|nr:hypothetical protein L226DRAFT_284039 [Lentinus tigrinus ALCF2SS1-7]
MWSPVIRLRLDAQLREWFFAAYAASPPPDRRCSFSLSSSISLASAFSFVMCSISSSRRPRLHHDLPRLAPARFGGDALRRASHPPPHTVHSWKMFRAQPASMVTPRRSFHAPHAAVISSTHLCQLVAASLRDP